LEQKRCDAVVGEGVGLVDHVYEPGLCVLVGNGDNGLDHGSMYGSYISYISYSLYSLYISYSTLGMISTSFRSWRSR
jgi:hypothetical protein